jgi:putative hydrolase of the HAD superfamily
LTNKNSIRYLLFDLDETMYPTDTGIMDLISQRINEYMSLRLGIDPEDVATMRQRYYEQYGTTGRGLYLHHELDLQEYFEFVHDLPVEDVLQRDSHLDQMLESLPEEKAIFTNATAAHAWRVLQTLGVERHFDRIIDIEELQYIPKPDIRAYHTALAVLEARADQCVLVDDRARNLEPGRELGMTTVLVGAEGRADRADFVVENVADVGQIMATIRSRHR